LVLSSVMSFLTLYSLTESVLVDNAEPPLRQAKESFPGLLGGITTTLKFFLTCL
jgi:hypothetical protein